jgi:Flp pilus assembly protein CpaB
MDNGGPAGDLSSPPAQRLVPKRWLDVRVVFGIVLLLGSMIGGARLLAAAEHETAVWAAAHDLAPGERLSARDLTRVRVRLNGAAAGYLTGTAPAGYVVVRFVAARELLPAGALATTARTDSSRLVTLPVQAGHLPPDLAPGDRVDVYLTPRSAGGPGIASATLPPTLVLAAAVVQSPPSGGRTFGADAALSVVLVVPAQRVADVVRAAESGAVDLVDVPAGDAGGGT